MSFLGSIGVTLTYTIHLIQTNTLIKLLLLINNSLDVEYTESAAFEIRLHTLGR